MKREDFLDSLEYLDEELIREADQARGMAEPDLKEKGRPSRRKTISPVRWGSLAAGFIVLIVSFSVIAGVMRVQSGNMASSQKAENTEAAAAPDSNAEQPEMEEAEMQEMEAEEMPAAHVEENFTEEDAVNEEAETEADTAEGVMEEAAAAEDAAAEDAVYEAAAAENTAGEYAPAEAPAFTVAPAETKKSDNLAAMPAAEEESVKIRIMSDAGEVVFALNDTPAAKSLVSQLPLRAESELYGSNEIVFHPKEPLDTENGTEGGGTAGYLGYFEPWNNIVMYYGDFDEYPGLYILGEAVSGAACIRDIRGGITVELITQEGGSN